MDTTIRKHLNNLRSEERELQNQAFFYILKETEKPVDWAYEVWDERFVTARHCLQSIWKVGASGKEMQQKVVEAFADRFKNCAAEKNCTLIRYDIIQGLKNLYDEVKDERIKHKALELIDTEEDLNYRKNYARIWK